MCEFESANLIKEDIKVAVHCTLEVRISNNFSYTARPGPIKLIYDPIQVRERIRNYRLGRIDKYLFYPTISVLLEISALPQNSRIT